MRCAVLMKLHCAMTCSSVTRRKFHQLPSVPASSSGSPCMAQQSGSRLTEREMSLEFSMVQSPAVPGVLVLFLLLTCLQNIINPSLKISCSCKIVTVVCPLLSNNMRIGKMLQNNYRKIDTEVNTKFQPWDGKYPSKVLS